MSLITIRRHNMKKNILGKEVSSVKTVGLINGSTEFKENDTLVLFGQIKDLERMMNNEKG